MITHVESFLEHLIPNAFISPYSIYQYTAQQYNNISWSYTINNISLISKLLIIKRRAQNGRKLFVLLSLAIRGPYLIRITQTVGPIIVNHQEIFGLEKAFPIHVAITTQRFTSSSLPNSQLTSKNGKLKDNSHS